MRNPIRKRRPKAPIDHNARIPGERFTVAFVMTGAVAAILLAFAFDFGNVWALAARLGVPAEVQPLTAPAVTISYLALMVGQQYLALRGWTNRELRKPRLWLLLIGVMTYALNCGDAFMREAYGEAAFDAVMPTLLLMWGELAPWLMRQVHTARERAAEVAEPAIEGDRVDGIERTLEELLAEFMAQDVAQEARASKPRGRRESRLRPTAREFIWKWLDDGKSYDDHPAAAWHKALVTEMGEGEVPTVERCRQIMREEFPKIKEKWEAAQKAKLEADERIEQMESLNA
ncbi:hypothetical protein [Streptomyces sp. CB03238]|uniref:hypothetical protein n=1 Tax=Streptomyces sp. CB03238 TaxID=1907777 RepID=UPI000A116869|nr:hypothetical protein [Streptomyces sp. CB03238]ORT58192.1 hypothetical protein BKD26_20020 [Streptomyces sp. CB03238]